ncbi:MAG: superoxide dismutase [Fe], partial [Betaproteobacteria bacterium]|nr:superoxide dismutase [Fe] [Betaproteobacteria bacterium]
MHFDLPPLPYAEDALAPVISAETLELHHGKHHKKYIDTTNQLLEHERVEGTTLEDVVRSSKGKLFNNAAQAWNHDFYWKSLSPKSAAPSGALKQRLERDF